MQSMLAWKYNPAFFIFGVASLLIIPAMMTIYLKRLEIRIIEKIMK